MSTALIFALVFAAVSPSAAPSADTLAGKRARSEAITARFAPSVAEMRLWFKLDSEGEKPTFRVAYLCPNCDCIHDRDTSEYLEKDRPLTACAFAVAEDEFLVQDFKLDPDWIDRIEIRFGAESAAASVLARYPGRNAVRLRTAKRLPGVVPLAFSERIPFAEDKDGVFFSSSLENGLAVVGAKPNTLGDFRRYPDVGLEVAKVVANSIAVNSSNEAVTVLFDTYHVFDRDDLQPPAKWKGEPVDAFVKRRQTAKREALEGLVAVYVHLDDEANRKDGFSRRYSRYSDENDLTELNLVGFALEDGELLVPLTLDASKMGSIDKMEAVLPDGQRLPLEFCGAFGDVCLAVFRFADGKLPAGVRPVRFDAKRATERFLEEGRCFRVYNYNGKLKAKVYEHRTTEFETGRGGEVYPDWSMGWDRKGQTFLRYNDGAIASFRAKYRDGDRYDEEPLSNGRIRALLRDREYDPQFAIRTGKDRTRIAWIGVEVQSLTEELAKEMKIVDLLASADTSGALVTKVHRGTAAEKAGFKEGDVLLNVREANRHKTQRLSGGDNRSGFDWDEFFGAFDSDNEEFLEMLGMHVPEPWPNVEGGINEVLTRIGIGRRVVVSFLRGAERKEAELVLEQAPVHFRTAKQIKNRTLGIKVADLTFEVRSYFKMKDDDPGVVVTKIQPGNPAAVAGLRPLEIITHVDNAPVKDAKDFAQRIKGRKTITFSVRRLAATRVVRIDLGEKPRP